MAVLSLVLCMATGALVWLGFVTTREWSRGTSLLLERRQAEALSLIGTALNRDLRGAWTRVLVPFTSMILEEDPPLAMMQLTSRAFARFPYPESLLVWKRQADGTSVTYAFSRTDRQPPWIEGKPEDSEPFPVVLTRNPPALRDVVDQLQRLAVDGRTFAVLEASINDVPYQVVGHFIYMSAQPHALLGVAAFTVNLQWIRQEYFGPLLKQVARIGRFEDSLSVAILDHQGVVVAGTGSQPIPEGVQWSFPLLFIDPSVVGPMMGVRIGRRAMEYPRLATRRQHATRRIARGAKHVRAHDAGRGRHCLRAAGNLACRSRAGAARLDEIRVRFERDA